MKQLHWIVLFVLLPSLAFSGKDFDEFKLNLLFVNATKNTSNADLENNTIIPWVEEAQRQYITKPSLKLSYTIERKKILNGLDLSELNFKSMTEFGKFMDDNFDNYARTKTEGHLTILVGNTLCWSDGKKCWGGWASFPHDVNPFNRKKGIWLSEESGSYVFAHELGHFWGLKHTFEPYVGFNKQCNKEFGNKNILNPDIGHCNSCDGKIALRIDSKTGNEFYVCENGVSNVMDYCRSVVPDASGIDAPGTETLNVCQQERAASQRKQYMTRDGKVNYIKLAGMRGEGACSRDSDCKSNEFCTAGVLDLKRNVCKVKLTNGALCTKDRQCQAGRCKSGFCSAPASVSMNGSCRFNDECRAGKCNAPIGGVTKGICVCERDSDCNTGEYCNKGGIFGVGKNICSKMVSPTCPGGWRYEIRNPLKKDRCVKTTTLTKPLKCKLLATDVAKNWTGPHAKNGADECRSKKGKKPKGVKCPIGYKYIIKSGADSCIKVQEEDRTPSCPSGYDYKSLSGKDQCRKN